MSKIQYLNCKTFIHNYEYRKIFLWCLVSPLNTSLFQVRPSSMGGAVASMKSCILHFESVKDLRRTREPSLEGTPRLPSGISYTLPPGLIMTATEEK